MKERTDKILNDVRTALEAGKLKNSEADILKGKMEFSNSQIFGTMGALARHYLNRNACAQSIDPRIDGELEWSLKWWAKHFENPKPRTVPLGKFRKPVVIFTDGACEPADTEENYGLVAGYGGIMCDTEDCALEAFMGSVEGPLMADLTKGGEKIQMVGQSELVPCIASRMIWRDRLEGRLIIHFIDNDAARCALIKGG